MLMITSFKETPIHTETRPDIRGAPQYPSYRPPVPRFPRAPTHNLRTRPKTPQQSSKGAQSACHGTEEPFHGANEPLHGAEEPCHGTEQA